MVFQCTDGPRNAALDAMETSLGLSPILTVRTGLPPVSGAAAATGTVLATITLPADWMAPASGGQKLGNMAGWADNSADATGRAGHYRITGSSQVFQGLCSDPHQFSKVVAVGDQVHNVGNTYRATVGGTTGAASAPVHTSGTAADGTVTWQFVQNFTDMTIDNASLNLGQQFTVTAYQLNITGA